MIVTDKAQLQELSTVWQGAGHIAGAAAAIALVIPEPPSERRKVTDQYDVGQATMAMMIAATDLGIGTGHSSVGDQDKARAILGVPEGYEVAYLLGIGYPADRSSPSANQTGGPSMRSSITGIGELLNRDRHTGTQGRLRNRRASPASPRSTRFSSACEDTSEQQDIRLVIVRPPQS